VPAAALAAYAGEYEGGRIVSIVDGKLHYSPRAGAPPEPLVPLGGDTFALGATRLVFERSGAGAPRLRIQLPEGEALTYARVRAARG
jgi:hypothetical protein